MSDDKPELFTMGMVLDVARVIEAHGYDALIGQQVIELQQHLFHFLYGAELGVDQCTGHHR